MLSGRYRLIAPIGAGASALVFLADDTRLRRRVAVKLLHQALADDDAFLRRFRSEAQSAAAITTIVLLAASLPAFPSPSITRGPIHRD